MILSDKLPLLQKTRLRLDKELDQLKLGEYEAN